MKRQMVKLVCPKCGSDEVLADAYAEWDVDSQNWVLRTEFDNKICDSCSWEFKTADEVELPLPNLGEWLFRRTQIEFGSIWSYKGKLYRVNTLMEKNLSQDPDTGEWRPSVRYTCEPQTDLVFYRADTEWLRKFTLTRQD